MSARLLNPYQRNSVAITLRMLETSLQHAVADLKHQEQGILYRQIVTLTDSQYEQIKQAILEAAGEIARLANTFALPVEVRDSRTDLQGQLAVLWSDLQEIRAAKLRGYGAVAPGLEPVLDPSVLHLIKLVESLTGILSEKMR
jgi:hypothetical protein